VWVLILPEAQFTGKNRLPFKSLILKNNRDEMKRKYIDCRDFPNEIGCTLLISGNTKEVFNVALRHAIEEHGHKDTSEIRKLIKIMMKDESKLNRKHKSANNNK